MKPIPVLRAKVPAYPTRLQILADPSILERHVPPAWRATRDVASAVAVFLAANAAGCASGGKGSSGATPSAAVVAPIFEHGEGRGAIGCIVVSPPVFLSEEEAMLVIADEMERNRVRFAETDVWTASLPSKEDVDCVKDTLKRIDENIREFENSPERHSQELQLQNEIRNSMRTILGKMGKPLRMNASDAASKVEIVFVSEGMGCKGGLGSVTPYDCRQAATDLSDTLRKHGRAHFYGIFYDPVFLLGPRMDSRGIPRRMDRMEARIESRELLREQVKDFIDWLKAQGAI